MNMLISTLNHPFTFGGSSKTALNAVVSFQQHLHFCTLTICSHAKFQLCWLFKDCCCFSMLGKCTSHLMFMTFNCILQCNALLVFLPLEHIAWQQEEAPCGGPFMSEAYIFEWTSAPPPAKHKHLTIERNMRKRLKHSAVHGSMPLLFL